MSAIAVIYNLNGRPVEREELNAVLETLKHRGRDGSGTWTNNEVGFGHLQHWTTPESLYENLPLKSSETSVVITCDARIDNRKELIPQLSFAGKALEQVTDSEIILKAYERWGKDCLPKLIGDFVFAIWDPNKKEIFCARDSLGVKSFYYYYEPGKLFALASEIKALFSIPEIPRQLNEENLGDYLVFNFEDKESTFFKGIKRLPATHAMTVSATGLHIWQYWKPDSIKELKLRNHREYQEAFKEKFTEAVACRLRSAFPIGAYLSGGLDSSSIVCVASDILKESKKPPLHSFSAVFPTVSEFDKKIDERSYMESVIKKTGCQANFVKCDDYNPFDGMKELMWHADNPVGAPNIYIDWKIFQEAKKRNVRVLLSGIDGDSTVSYGYEDFSEFIKRGWWLRFIKEAVLLNRRMPNPKHAPKNVVFRLGMENALPTQIAYLRRLLRKETKHSGSSQNFNTLQWKILNKDFRRKNKLEERFRSFLKSSYSEKSTNIKGHWEGLTCGLFAKLFENVETTSHAFSIEMRYPFFDRRLIEFCIALPPGERIYNGWTRAIFRYAMDGILPENVRWRQTKSNLSGGVHYNLLKDGNDEMEDVFNCNLKVLENYIDISKLKAVYHEEVNKAQSFYGTLVLITTVYLSNWLRENGFAVSQG